MRAGSLPAGWLSAAVLWCTRRTLAQTPPYQNASGLALPASGAGPSYATACNNAWQSYMTASSSYIVANQQVSTTTQLFGGVFTNAVTYYANATTLCDGVARVAESPAIPISTGLTTGTVPVTSTSTETFSAWFGSSGPSPSCSILPSDCDVLYSAYSSSLSQWSSNNPASATVTPPPNVPYCTNQTEVQINASIGSFLSGCGPCTIFGNEVQLVYFPVPTTVSRDMCASTPSASLTYYAKDAVLQAYAGTAYSGDGPNSRHAPTATIGQHTFTSGTAYISIGTVWAINRCSTSFGSVNNAILAMPSSSVLSLRYSQDHFQYLAVSSTQTGYPVDYADFNSPVPWSAYNGQAQCYGPTPGPPCQVIYEGQYRPQLAIPPGIRELDPSWATCQMWYGGLYDPPLALQPASYVELATRPSWQSQSYVVGDPVGGSGTMTATEPDDGGVTRPPTPASTAFSGIPATTSRVRVEEEVVTTVSVVHVHTVVTVARTGADGSVTELEIGTMTNVAMASTYTTTISEPEQMGSAQSDSAQSDSGDGDSAGTDSAQGDSVNGNSAGTDSAQSDSAQTNPTQTDSAQADAEQSNASQASPPESTDSGQLDGSASGLSLTAMGSTHTTHTQHGSTHPPVSANDTKQVSAAARSDSAFLHYSKTTIHLWAAFLAIVTTLL